MPPEGETAGLPFPPPLIPLGGLLAALVLHLLAPLAAPFRAPVFGAAAIIAALVLAGWGLLSLRRAGTDVRPHVPTTRIVTHGPYGFSRNPLYLAMALFVAGAALLSGSLWAWVAAFAVPPLLDRIVIRREEVYLAGRFGAPYAAYRARVRRWL
jgi:protein-S-isoprenylcysteine O-methyltransferase Ste14